MDENLLEAAGHHVPGLGVAPVTDVGHEVHSLELPPNSVVNTLGLPPAVGELDIAVRLVPDELLSPLLDDLRPGGRSNSHDYYKFSEINSVLGQPLSDTLRDVRRR